MAREWHRGRCLVTPGSGILIDAEYQLVSADTVDTTFTGGIFQSGSSDLDVFAVEGGYMLFDKVELVAGYEMIDADTYDTAWNRTSVGLNYFIAKHKVKWQLTWRMGENVLGSDGLDGDVAFLQIQYVF